MNDTVIVLLCTYFLYTGLSCEKSLFCMITSLYMFLNIVVSAVYGKKMCLLATLVC
jgi:hypothetical protein